MVPPSGEICPNLCIGCSFCAGICPCGVWEMEENLRPDRRHKRYRDYHH